MEYYKEETQRTNICSKSIIETQKQGVKFVPKYY